MMINEIFLDQQKDLFLELTPDLSERQITASSLKSIYITFLILQKSRNEQDPIDIFLKVTNIRFYNNCIELTVKLTELRYLDSLLIEIKSLLITLKTGEKLKIPFNEKFDFSEISVRKLVKKPHDLAIKGQQVKSEDPKIELIKISQNFGTFVKKISPHKRFFQMQKEVEKRTEALVSPEVPDLEGIDYDLRERLLECVFLSLANITGIRVLKEMDVSKIVSKLIEIYFKDQN